MVADRLRGHVEQLAARIGERNLGRPGTLEAAADYVEAQWRSNGYEVRRQVYECTVWPAPTWRRPWRAMRARKSSLSSVRIPDARRYP